MARDQFLITRGPKAKLPNLALAEPALTTDANAERLYIGGNSGNVPFPNMLDFVDAQYFGVLPDIGDITTELQEAIDYCTANKKSLKMRNGTYTITSTINITGDGFIIIEGSGGVEQNTIITGSFEGDLFNCSSTYLVTFKDLTIDHTGTAGSLINFSDGEAHQVIDCTLKNAVGNASDMVKFYFSNARILNSRFTNNEATAYCVRAGKTIVGIHINSYIIGNIFAGVGKGVIVDSDEATKRVEGIKIIENTFINTGAEQITIKSVLDAEISSNMLDQGSNSSILLQSFGLFIDGVRISNNYISTATNITEGIAVNVIDNAKAVKYIDISHNRITYCGYGVLTYDNCDNFNVSDNMFVDINHTAISYNECVDSSVVNNKFVNCDFDLTLTDGALGGDFVVESNIFSGNLLFTKTDASKFIIGRNSGYKPRGFSSATFDASTTGNKFANIPHGLDGTPDLGKCTIGVSTLGGSLETGGMWIISADAVNVTVAINVVVAQATPNPNVNLYCEI